MQTSLLHASLLLVLFFLNAAFPFESAAQDEDEAPDAERIRQLAEVIGRSDPEAARAFAEESYAESFIEMAPMERHVAILMDPDMRRFELREVQSEGPTQATGLLYDDLTELWREVVVEVESEAPHRITGIRLRPAAPPEGQQITEALSDADLRERLSAYLERLAGADAFSGAVLLAHEGEVVFEEAYGEANKDFGAPNRVDTKFNLGSMNKMFTAVAVLQLVEEDRLSLDDPLSKYLPDFPSPEAAEKIQIKHLLTHTSGLGSYFTEEFQRSSRAHFRTVDDFMELAEGDSLRFEPGTEWRYSNTGFLVLGKVIEEVTGQSYFDYVEENIYEPVDMASTEAFELDRVNENLAVGYEKEAAGDTVSYRNNLFEHVVKGGPAGGGYSTVRDLLGFAQALRSGEFLGEEYVDMLLAPKPELNSPRYGFGFGIDPETRIAGHSGGFMGISSNLDLFLGEGYTAVVLSNYGGASQPVVEKIRRLVQAGTEQASAR